MDDVIHAKGVQGVGPFLVRRRGVKETFHALDLVVIVHRLRPMGQEGRVATEGWHVLAHGDRGEHDVFGCRVFAQPVEGCHIVLVQVEGVAVMGQVHEPPDPQVDVGRQNGDQKDHRDQTARSVGKAGFPPGDGWRQVVQPLGDQDHHRNLPAIEHVDLKVGGDIVEGSTRQEPAHHEQVLGAPQAAIAPALAPGQPDPRRHGHDQWKSKENDQVRRRGGVDAGVGKLGQHLLPEWVQRGQDHRVDGPGARKTGDDHATPKERPGKRALLEPDR